tara:strand:- start:4644 stop:5498 length:855 start_codon:yes stop_codon:yes gene_type:complete
MEKLLEKNKLSIVEGDLFSKSILHCGRCCQKFYARPTDLVRRSKGTCSVCRTLKDNLLSEDRVILSYNKKTKERTLYLEDYGVVVSGSSTTLNNIYEEMYFPKPEETFKFIKDTDRLFAASNLGNIVSLNNYPTLVGSTSGPYRRVGIKYIGEKMKQYYIHTVIAETYIAKKNVGEVLCVNHKDGNKLNNVVSNLEWVTYQENTAHAIRTGLQDPCGFGNNRTPVRLEKGCAYHEFESIQDAGRFLKDKRYTNSTLKNVASYLCCALNPARAEKKVYGFTITRI